MNRNQETAARLNEMELSEVPRELISVTDFNHLYDMFGQCETAEDVERLTAEVVEILKQ